MLWLGPEEGLLRGACTAKYRQFRGGLAQHGMRGGAKAPWALLALLIVGGWWQRYLALALLCYLCGYQRSPFGRLGWIESEIPIVAEILNRLWTWRQRQEM